MSAALGGPLKSNLDDEAVRVLSMAIVVAMTCPISRSQEEKKAELAAREGNAFDGGSQPGTRQMTSNTDMAGDGFGS